MDAISGGDNATKKERSTSESSEKDGAKLQCNLRTSTRLLNKQKISQSEKDVSTSDVVTCKCNTSSCETCTNLSSANEGIFSGRKRDFWSVQEQQDFFDGLKLYGKDFHSIYVHMKSVVKRRTRIASSPSHASDSSKAVSYKLKSKEQLRHFYYRKLQLCQRLVGTCDSSIFSSHPRDLREVYMLLCYDALKKIFRDKLDPRLARPDFSHHLNQMINSGSTVVRVGRKNRFKAKPPTCQALRSWNFIPPTDGRGSGSGDPVDPNDPSRVGVSFGPNAGIPLASVPSTFVLELLPSNNFSWSFVQSVAHNPRLAVTAYANTKLEEIKSLVEEKWRYRSLSTDFVNNPTVNAKQMTVTFKVSQSPNRQGKENDGCATSSDANTQLDILASEKMLQMSLVELYLLSTRTESSKNATNTIQLEYTINLLLQNQGESSEKPLFSPALTKLLYLASIKSKPPTFSSTNRNLSPSRVNYLPRIDEEGSTSNNADQQRKPGAITPRRRNISRRLAVGNHIVGSAAQQQPVSTTTAVNFIEQLKELRVKTQRRFNNSNSGNRSTTSNDSATHVIVHPLPELQSSSPKFLQQRRIMPKPVPTTSQALTFEGQTNIAARPTEDHRLTSNNSATVIPLISAANVNPTCSVSSTGPSVDQGLHIVITPYPMETTASGKAIEKEPHLQCLDLSAQSPQTSMLQPPPTAPAAVIAATTSIATGPSYAPTFADTSLDSFLPSESTLVEMLKTPYATSAVSAVSEKNSANAMDLGAMGIISGRPISPNGTSGFDISFGDPSLGGFLINDAASTSSLVNKNNSLTPWLLQESSMSFFDPNGPTPFDESSFLLPATTSTHQPSTSRPNAT